MKYNMNRHEQSLIYALNVLKQKEYKQYISAIYLYGSCARGTQSFDSDVDLLIRLSDSTPKKLLRRMRVDVTPDISLPEVELKFYFGNTFSNSFQFNKNIEQEGILLWEKK